MLKKGSTIGEYKVIEQIGEGGNSFIYKVERNNEFFALKILKKETRGEKKERFENEVEFQMKTKCKNIVKIITRGKIIIHEDNKHTPYEYYVMPIYKTSFRSLIDNNNDYSHLLKLFLDICEGLKFIHNYSAKPIIHRDLKPENFLYDEINDKLLIADFGIACFNTNNKNIKTGNQKMGNFSYSAPEQRKIKNKTYGPQTDIYAMGLILNEIFTKEISNGINYKKISSINPLYSDLDDLVSSMLLNDFNERENDINNVINKIKHAISNLDNIYEDIENEFKTQLNNVHDKSIKNIIKNDLCILNYLIEHNHKFDYPINLYYHNNITYNFNELFANSLKLINIRDYIYDKFVYESEEIQYDNPNIINSSNTVEINNFINIIKNIKCFNDGILESLKKQSIKLFLSLYDYHQEEVINYISKLNYNGNYIFSQILDSLSIFNNYCDITDDALNSFINIDKNSYLLEYDSINNVDYIFNISNNKNKIILRDLYEKFNITINFDKKIKLISYDNPKLDMILNKIKSKLSEAKGVEYSDLIDAQRIIQCLKNDNFASCDMFILDNIIAQKILKDL